MPYISIMTTMTTADTPVTLSASAAKQINVIMAKQGFDKYLRVAVEGGGCELIGAAFKIINPNATANCGCGTSFSV